MHDAIPKFGQKRLAEALLEFSLSRIFLYSICLSREELFGKLRSADDICDRYAQELGRIEHLIVDHRFRPDPVSSRIDQDDHDHRPANNEAQCWSASRRFRICSAATLLPLARSRGCTCFRQASVVDR